MSQDLIGSHTWNLLIRLSLWPESPRDPPLSPEDWVTIHLTLYLGSGAGDQVLTFSQQALCLLSHLPRHRSAFVKIQESLIIMINDLCVFRMEIISSLYFSLF